MRILQLAPLWFPVAKDAPGGIESFLAQLVPGLERRGCDVTLLAAAESAAGADIVVAAVPLVRAMQEGTAAEYAYFEQHLLRLALERAGDFDVVHSHIGAAAYVLSALQGVGGRVLHTVHTPVTPDMAWFFGCHPDAWISAVSEHQARKLAQSGARRCTAIPNGICGEDFQFQPRSGGGLLFMGRMEAVKGPDLAVRVACELGRPLTLAGPITDPKYFTLAIEPFLNDVIRYVGVADHRRKVDLFGDAACALLPFRREEPFGMVAVEAMACGTPVVALDRGAMPEIVDPGVTGYLADTEENLAAAVVESMKLDRQAVRARALSRFSIDDVAERYYRLYCRIAAMEPRVFEDSLPCDGRR
jgi:glycosyltransferase involved in cell wall biosynthesis